MTFWTLRYTQMDDRQLVVLQGIMEIDGDFDDYKKEILEALGETL